MPLWRVQAKGAGDVIAVRKQSHPGVSSVTRSRVDRLDRGFVIEWEDAWEDEQGPWTCRQIARADVVDGAIAELSVYCTCDWDQARRDEHAAAAVLLRP